MFTKQDLDKLNPFASMRKINRSQGAVVLAVSKLEDELLGSRHPDRTYDFDVYLPTYGVNLQRPYVWTPEQQEELIMSKLLEKTIPPVVIISHEYKLYQVIDGKQRLLTFKKFFMNEFPIHINGEEVYWKDFDGDMKYHMNCRNPILTELYYSYDEQPITDEEKIIIFNHYNFTGTPQEVAHKELLQSLIRH